MAQLKQQQTKQQQTKQQQTEQRQSLRLVRQIPCALRPQPTAEIETIENHTPIAGVQDRLDSLANEFQGCCEQIHDRPTLNALRCLQRQVDQLHSVVTTELAQQASWTRNPADRRLCLSFDGLEIELLPQDQVPAGTRLLDVMLQIDGLPTMICALRVADQTPQRIHGSFEQIAEADLRRIRRYVLLQDAAKGAALN